MAVEHRSLNSRGHFVGRSSAGFGETAPPPAPVAFGDSCNLIIKDYRYDRTLVLVSRPTRCLTLPIMTMQVRPFSQHNNGTKNPIYVTSQDKQRLEDLLMEIEVSDPREHGDLKALTQELRRAVVVDPKDVFSDVITMNSHAEMRDLETGETVAFTLVFPSEANIDEEKISVLAPIGAGMLGYRVGDEFEWNVPGGLRRMKVTKVEYQPEAAGDFDR